MVTSIEDYDNYISVICTNPVDKEENTNCSEYDKKDEYVLISDPIKRIADKIY